MTSSPPKPRRWVVILVTLWAIVLVGGLLWAIRTGEPTAREQTSVAQARPVVDEATARLAEAAGSDRLAVVSISDFVRVDDCAVTLLRSGVRYQRVVNAVVAPGTEEALLLRVADRLPAAYQASVFTGTAPRLVADAGFWVRVGGNVAGPGHVRLVADTGECRPAGDLGELAAASGGDRSALDPLVAKLDLDVGQWHTYRSGCPDGGEMSTVEAVGADGSLPGDLDTRLDGLGGPVVAGPQIYGYFAGDVAIAARADDTHVVLTATTTCRVQ